MTTIPFSPATGATEAAWAETTQVSKTAVAPGRARRGGRAVTGMRRVLSVNGRCAAAANQHCGSQQRAAPAAAADSVWEPVGLGERRLRFGRSGPFFTGLLSHSSGDGPANPAKTVLAGAKFRVDAPSPTGSWPAQSCPRTGLPAPSGFPQAWVGLGFKPPNLSTWKPQLDAPEWAVLGRAGKARRRCGLMPARRRNAASAAQSGA